MNGRNLGDWIKHLFIPHEGNGFRPGAAGGVALAVVLALVVLLQAAYTLDTAILQKRSDFLASVLPSVLVSLTNADRADIGAGELRENAVLRAAAQAKADDMAAKGYFSHVTPDGKQPWHWIEQAGYEYEYAGENLAVDFEDTEAVEEAWMKSPTHHANIVKPQYTEIGIAVAKGTYKGEEVTFVVQFFASPAPAPVTAFAKAPPAAQPVLTPAEEVPLPDEESVPVVSTPEVIAEATSAPAVLGTEAAPPAAPSVFEKVAASPLKTVTYALSALAIIALIMLVLAFLAHLKLRYIEGIGAAFAVLVITVGALAFNTEASSQIEIPSDIQSASVINALHFTP